MNFKENSPFFQYFKEPIQSIELPEKFTFPFYYDPHPLCILAAKELQIYLENQTDWVHNFGIDNSKTGLAIGKMFGVLVVQNQADEIGYLAAFSGKLANQNQHSKFVPPIFDMLTKESFFKKEEEILNQYNRKIKALEDSEELQKTRQFLKDEKSLSLLEIAQQKKTNKEEKQKRDLRRDQLNIESNVLEDLKNESIHQSYQLKKLVKTWKERLEEAQSKLDVLLKPINDLKQERKQKSNALQYQLFDQYHFLNKDLKLRSLESIFSETAEKTPPSGAGECAAPKLLQYAFQNNLKPIALAEFWWGTSPSSEIRKHGNFYPSCRGKCEPILGHMLEGISMDENPMLTNPGLLKKIEIIYEDAYLAVINKPEELLSVPGRNIEDSVYSRMKAMYPEATGPLTVHRLDMSTSGIMLIAKTLKVHEHLQRQFIKKMIKKRYVALLDGLIEEDEGIIELPLRVDLDNRPQQLVCYEHGKKAITKWKVIDRSENKTRIHFFPITGRTHQLRVHSAHPSGLNTPIVGDDLYGLKADRLHLHAEWIEFFHPIMRDFMNFEIKPAF